MSKVIVGSTDVTRATFYDENKLLTDPASVVAWVKRPDGTVTATGISIVHVATGIYDVAVDIITAGLWYLEVTGSGPQLGSKVLEKTICAVWSSVA